MGRLLLLAAIIVVVYLLIRAFRGKAPSARDNPVAEDMVRCARCGLHLPRSESIESGGRFYCGIEHRDADHQ